MSQYLEILQNNLPKLFAVFSIFTVSFYTYIWYKIAANFENVPQKKHDSYESIPLSILIPFRNEADRIIPLLDSILQLRNKNGLEFIFIDDHSSDNTLLLTFPGSLRNHPVAMYLSIGPVKNPPLCICVYAAGQRTTVPFLGCSANF